MPMTRLATATTDHARYWQMPSPQSRTGEKERRCAGDSPCCRRTARWAAVGIPCARRTHGAGAGDGVAGTGGNGWHWRRWRQRRCREQSQLHRRRPRSAWVAWEADCRPQEPSKEGPEPEDSPTHGKQGGAQDVRRIDLTDRRVSSHDGLVEDVSAGCGEHLAVREAFDAAVVTQDDSGGNDRAGERSARSLTNASTQSWG